MKITKDTTLEEFVGIVSEQLRKHGIEAVLSGGALAGIYSDGEYRSKDVDMVTSAGVKQISAALAEIGFVKGSGRHFYHPATELIVEFPTAPVFVGSEYVQQRVQLDTLGGRITVLSPTDAVKDRLSGYIHWKEASNFEQARLIAEHRDINIAAVVAWAKKENAPPEVITRIEAMLKAAAKLRARAER